MRWLAGIPARLRSFNSSPRSTSLAGTPTTAGGVDRPSPRPSPAASDLARDAERRPDRHSLAQRLWEDDAAEDDARPAQPAWGRGAVRVGPPPAPGLRAAGRAAGLRLSALGAAGDGDGARPSSGAGAPA